MDLTLYQGKEINNEKEEFYIDDESRYSMSGKVLRCILDQLPEDSKVPFADISFPEVQKRETSESDKIKCDMCSKEAIEERAHNMCKYHWNDQLNLKIRIFNHEIISNQNRMRIDPYSEREAK